MKDRALANRRVVLLRQNCGFFTGFCLLLAILGHPGALEAQQNSYLNSVGVPTFSLTMPVENGNINMSNGNLHLEIPIGDPLPQRAGNTYRAVLMYDSAIWYGWHSGTGNLWWPSVDAGWRLVTSADQGKGSYTQANLTCDSAIYGPGSTYEVDFNNFSWTAPDGTFHQFPILLSKAVIQGDPDCPFAITTTSSDAFAADRSGYHMYAITNGGTQVIAIDVYAPDGTHVFSGGTSGLPGTNGPTDSNGNYYSRDTTYNTRLNHTNPIDMLGRQPILMSTSGSSDYIDVLTSQGTRQRYTIVWQNISVNTNFGQVGLTEYSGTRPVIQEIDLPDGTKYQFSYDQGTTAGHFGVLTGMTLPTGGQVSYSYTTFSDSYNAKYRWVTGRTTSGTGITSGTWSYTPQVIGTCPGGGVNCQQKNTLTAPSGNATVYTFNFNGGPWANQIQNYTGSPSTGTLLSTTAQTFDYGQNCPANVQCNMPGAAYVVKLAETTTLPIPGGNINQAKQTSWDSSNNGNIKQISEWNSYGSVKPTNADRTTCFTYLTGTTYSNVNMVNRATNVTVVDNWSSTPCTSTPSAHIVSQTLNAYDGSAVASATLKSAHDDTHFGTGYTARGNITQVQKLVSGSTYLISSSTYDMTGQRVTSTDWNGNQTSYDYSDNLYDDPGDGSTPTVHSVSTATNAYLKTVTYPTVGSTTLTETMGYYWGSGKIALKTDVNNNTSYFHFNDPLDRPTATLLPNTEWTRTAYSSSGTQGDTYTGTTNPSASTSCSVCRHDQAVVDVLGRPISQVLVNDPSGTTTTVTAYDSSGRVASVSNPYRSTSDATYGLETPSYDGIGRTTQVQHPDGDLLSKYSGAAVSSGGGATSQLCATATYGFGYPVLVKDEVGNKRQTWVDGFGRTIEADEPNATGSQTVNTCYKYDLNNNLTQVTAQSSQTRNYSFDLISRPTLIGTPESGTTNLYYTTSGGTLCSGNPISVCRRIDARSITSTYAYDAMNRLISVSYSDSTPAVKYGYDSVAPTGCTPPTLTSTNGKGRRSSMCDGSGSIAMSFDTVGNILRQKRTLNGVTENLYYTYNLDSSIASVQFESGRTVTYTEGNAGRITSVQDTANSINYVTNALYAPQGALSSMQNGASLISTIYYNNRLQPCRISEKSSGTAPTNCTDSVNKGNIFDIAYSYVQGTHNNGSITGQTNNVDSGRSQSYGYDSLNRLLTASSQATSGADCWGQSFGNNATPPTLAADALGNMFYTTTTQCSSPQPRFTPNTSNRFTDTGITYDAAGNMTNDGIYAYTYDAENRLITASGMTGGPYCYTYNGDGLRVMKAHACTGTPTVDVLYWRGISGDTFAETSAGGSVSNSSYHEYVFFEGRRIARSDVSSSTVYYNFVDALGSTRVMAQGNGTVCFKMEYYPFGQEQPNSTTTCNTSYKFTGYESDVETALDYAFARFYNPRLGRFMSSDPLAGTEDAPQSLNRYTYVLNNPTNFIDPRGLITDPNAPNPPIFPTMWHFDQLDRTSRDGLVNDFAVSRNKRRVQSPPGNKAANNRSTCISPSFLRQLAATPELGGLYVAYLYSKGAAWLTGGTIGVGWGGGAGIGIGPKGFPAIGGAVSGSVVVTTDGVGNSALVISLTPPVQVAAMSRSFPLDDAGAAANGGVQLTVSRSLVPTTVTFAGSPDVNGSFGPVGVDWTPDSVSLQVGVGEGARVGGAAGGMFSLSIPICKQ